jgi:xanthine dehydrogenase YagS FAD-binding subunit
VATKPWRLGQVEQVLLGRKPDARLAAEAADRATEGATPRPGNAYKLPLLRNIVERALLELGGAA